MRLKQETAGVQTGSSISHTSRVYNRTCRCFFYGPFISCCCIFLEMLFLLPSQGLNMLHLKVGRHPLKAPNLRSS